MQRKAVDAAEVFRRLMSLARTYDDDFKRGLSTGLDMAVQIIKDVPDVSRDEAHRGAVNSRVSEALQELESAYLEYDLDYAFYSRMHDFISRIGDTETEAEDERGDYEQA